MEITNYIKTIWDRIGKPIVVYDVETTGLNDTDEIIEFAAIKVLGPNLHEELTFRCKPTVPINEEATKAHGIKIEDLAKEKSFKIYASKIDKFFKDALVGGFNIKSFDNKILDRQMAQYGFKDIFKDKIILDSYSIYKKQSTRKLTDAVKFYTGQDIQDAHSALGDIKSTIACLAKQLEIENKPIDNIVSEQESIGIERYLKKDGAEWILCFGKHSGKKISEVEVGFLNWILMRDFPEKLKNIIKEYLNGKSKPNQNVA